MKSLDNTLKGVGIVALMLFGLAGASLVLAADNSQFRQVIIAGTLVTDIRSTATTSVASPSVPFTTSTVSFDCLEGGTASTGTFGTNEERIYVDNPGAADNGWTLSLAATTTASVWDSTTSTFDFNDPSGAPAGCADGGGDGDSVGGQLTIDPTGGTATADYSGGNTTGIALGGVSAAFSEGVTDSVTLATGSAGSDDVGRWYFTGISASQTIPAAQEVGTYVIDMVLTVVAT